MAVLLPSTAAIPYHREPLRDWNPNRMSYRFPHSQYPRGLRTPHPLTRQRRVHGCVDADEAAKRHIYFLLSTTDCVVGLAATVLPYRLLTHRIHGDCEPHTR